MKRFLLCILTLSLLCLQMAHAQAPLVGFIEHQIENGGLQREEENFLIILNRFRAQLHLRPVLIDPRLQVAATKHNEWMVETGKFGHEGEGRSGVGDRASVEGIAATHLTNEIIAAGSFTGKDTFLQWFFSPHHLQSMLDNDLDHAGVSRSGCMEGNSDQEENCYWTVDFAKLDHRRPNTNQAQQIQPKDLNHLTKEEVIDAAEMVVGPLDERKQRFSIKESKLGELLDRWKDALE